jgi:hypothetical protein
MQCMVWGKIGLKCTLSAVGLPCGGSAAAHLTKGVLMKGRGGLESFGYANLYKALGRCGST